MARLNHPGVLDLHGVCSVEYSSSERSVTRFAHDPPPHFGNAQPREEEETWLVTGLAAGSCKEYLQAHRADWTPEHWQTILAQVANAMTYLHSQHPALVHRDIKSENVLILPSRQNSGEKWPLLANLQVVLADFDRAADANGSGFEEPVGSPYYWAPEILRWERYGREVDVYAFGMLMFELTQLMSPFLGKMAPGIPGSLTAKEFAVEVGINGMRPRFLQDDADALRYRKLIEKCWHQDIQSRPTFPEIEVALEELASSA